VVKALRYQSEGLRIHPQWCRWGFFFPKLPTEPCALGSIHRLKTSTRKTGGYRQPVRKGDDLTTFIVPKVEKIRSLNLPDPQGPAQASSGRTLPVPYFGMSAELRIEVLLDATRITLYKVRMYRNSAVGILIVNYF
jgi:hypothetical protein